MVTDAEDPSRLKPNAAGTSNHTANAVRRPLPRVPQDPASDLPSADRSTAEAVPRKQSDSYALPAVSRTVLAIELIQG